MHSSDSEAMFALRSYYNNIFKIAIEMERPMFIGNDWTSEKQAHSIGLMAASDGIRKGAQPFATLADQMVARIKANAYPGLRQIVIRVSTRGEAIKVCEAMALAKMKPSPNST